MQTDAAFLPNLATLEHWSPTRNTATLKQLWHVHLEIYHLFFQNPEADSQPSHSYSIAFGGILEPARASLSQRRDGQT
jgi:hypothetical protein